MNPHEVFIPTVHAPSWVDPAPGRRLPTRAPLEFTPIPVGTIQERLRAACYRLKGKARHTAFSIASYETLSPRQMALAERLIAEARRLVSSN
jgi:hypothetical protein